MSFKFDEQFEFFDAYLKEKVKCVASKNNKRMKMLSQSSHGCWESKITAGDDFMVFVSIDSHSHFFLSYLLRFESHLSFFGF